MIKKIGLLIGLIILGVLVYAGLKSPEYEVTRSILINAPAEKIFPYLVNQGLARKWSPWEALDPDSKTTYWGPQEGVGAKTSWTGGKKMGTGSATITEVFLNRRVDIRLDYEEPMAMVQFADYQINPEGNANRVSWTVRGTNGFVERLMCLFVNMDKMVGSMFEQGLANLKTLVESQP
ncbi:MAG: SRPBCC family protein [Pseudobdellovibrionaceae bacterium]